jgi:hypothetical protein
MDRLSSYIAKQIPGFEIRTKEGSFLMRLLSFILFFNKFFMTRFVTTIYPIVYFPKEEKGIDDRAGNIIVLCHEYVHLRDRKKLGWLFNVLYLSPQIFALLALLAIPFAWQWVFCLLFLLPIPSPFRAYFEYRAYKISIAISYLLFDRVPPIEYYVMQFTTSNYYWMFPFEKFLTKKFNEHAKKLRKKEFDELTIELKNVLFPNKL